MKPFTTRPEILGSFGVVTSTHWVASAIGMSILERGGNAFDAAVAVGFSLQILEPHLNGPGGEVPIILNRAGATEVEVICGQGTAPSAATLSYYQDLGLSIVPGSGLLSAVVPGAFDAWLKLLLEYGTLNLRDVLQPAIDLAGGGFPVVPNITNTVKRMKPLFEDEWLTSAAIWLNHGEAPPAGQFFKLPKVAEFYRRVLNEAEDSKRSRDQVILEARKIWSQGFVAEIVDDFCCTQRVMDTTGNRHKGILTGDDMAGWSASIEQSVSYSFGEFTIHKTGPWGQGPVFLQQLALLKEFDWSGVDEYDPLFIHRVVEASKLAFADREAFYGDPNFVKVPLDELLSDTYNRDRAQLIDERCSMSLTPGKIAGYNGNITVQAQSSHGDLSLFGIGEPTVARFDEPVPNEHGSTNGDTCHFDIIDKWGNMVSATPSGGWLQSSPVIPELGFCLTNRAQMFWLDEASPACIGPKKRPRTTLTPSLAYRNEQPYMVFGTPGGDQQDQWALHFFLRHALFGLNLQESIDAPGFNTSAFPSSFFPRETDFGHLAVENRFPQSTIDDLKRRGHQLVVDDAWCLGRVTAASRAGDLLKAAANPRFMQGYAIGR